VQYQCTNLLRLLSSFQIPEFFALGIADFVYAVIERPTALHYAYAPKDL
jgi:hypothetical protein